MFRVPTNRRATIMPKKYLIYIHNNERFDTLNERGQKSNLINDLLEQHWTMQDLADKARKSPNGVAVPGVPGVRLAVATSKAVKPGEALVVPPADKNEPDPVKRAKKQVAGAVKIKNIETCPHGYAKGNCKKADCNKKFTAVHST